MRALLCLSLLAPALLSSCEVEGVEPFATDEGPVALFAVPRTGEEPFFDLPWPTDLRRVDGFIDVRDFPNPANTPLLRDYTEVMSTRLRGYSVSAAGYFRFSETLDVASLPTSPAASLEEGASIFLVALDTGERHPVVTHYWDPETLYWPGRCLAVRPVLGIPLRPETQYAIVLTRALRSVDGMPMGRGADFAAIAAGASEDPGLSDAIALYGAALEDVGVPAEDVISMAVFTTQHPTRELEQARDWLRAQPPPEALSWRFVAQEESYTLIEGEYESPIVQAGELPYSAEGGEILFGDDGNPLPQGIYEARFSMTIPRTIMPPAGYPIVLWAHGTGGDYQSYLRRPLPMTTELARRGIAVMGVDQIHHGTRNPSGGGEATLTYNVTNPLAFRDNNRQAALDMVEQARFVATTPVSARVINLDPPVSFDPDNILVFGHSQGGLNGPLFLAVDDQSRGGVLSGAGGSIPVALVEKTEPLDIPEVVQLFLRARGEAEHYVYEHPVFALLQTWLDVADPTSYAARWHREPREGFAPKSVLQTEGTSDAFTPPASIEALAVAGGLPLIAPERATPEAAGVLGLRAVAAPQEGNLADGGATGGLLQYEGGHFVAFEEGATQTIVEFLASFAGGVPRIP